MCFRRSRSWEESADEVRGRRLWDLFYRETEGSEPPAPGPVVEHEDERPEREEVPAGVEH